MKKKCICFAAAAILLIISCGAFGMDYIMNGSFENSFNSWDINVPGDFVADRQTGSGTTNGTYNLRIYSPRFGVFNPGDTAMATQSVVIKHSEHIIFDVKLSAKKGTTPVPWGGSVATAMVLIDGLPVWQSEPNADGQMLNVAADVNQYADGNSHNISLALQINFSGELNTSYLTQWDFVKFDRFCGGYGYLYEDINRDCYVNIGDIALMGQYWLKEAQTLPFAIECIDSGNDGIIGGQELESIAYAWLDCTSWADGNCLPLDYPPDANDINGDGVVNFYEYAVVAGGITDINDANDMREFQPSWLNRTWIFEP